MILINLIINIPEINFTYQEGTLCDVTNIEICHQKFRACPRIHYEIGMKFVEKKVFVYQRYEIFERLSADMKFMEGSSCTESKQYLL